MKSDQKVIHVQVRLSPEEYAAIKKLAAENASSPNGEILIAMREHIWKSQRQQETV